MDYKRPGFTHVVAMDARKGIGKNGNLVWRLPGDMAYFKKVTSTTTDSLKPNIVIMGRITWESIPAKFRPLTGRTNFVLTRDPQFSVPEGVFRFSSFEVALRRAQDLVKLGQASSIFVIGGASLYHLTLPLAECEKLILTKVHHTFNCDTFYPDIPSDFTKTENSDTHEDDRVSYHFETWERASK